MASKPLKLAVLPLSCIALFVLIIILAVCLAQMNNELTNLKAGQTSMESQYASRLADLESRANWNRGIISEYETCQNNAITEVIQCLRTEKTPEDQAINNDCRSELADRIHACKINSLDLWR